MEVVLSCCRIGQMSSLLVQQMSEIMLEEAMFMLVFRAEEVNSDRPIDAAQSVNKNRFEAI